LVLTVFNQSKVGITVTSITTTVGNASAACPAADFYVTRFTGSLAIPAFHAASVTVVATMSHSAPDACQGAVFPLYYSGLGHGS
jgi:hypothetical protein